MSLITREIPACTYERGSQTSGYCVLEAGNKHVLMGTSSNEISFFNPDSMEVVATVMLQCNGAPKLALLSPGEQYLLVADESGYISIFSLTDGLIGLQGNELHPEFLLPVAVGAEEKRYKPVAAWLDDNNAVVSTSKGSVLLLSRSIMRYTQRGSALSEGSNRTGLRGAFARHRARSPPSSPTITTNTNTNSTTQTSQESRKERQLWMDVVIYNDTEATEPVIQLDGTLRQMEDEENDTLLFTVTCLVSTLSSAFLVEHVGSVKVRDSFGITGPGEGLGSPLSSSIVEAVDSSGPVTTMGHTVVAIGSRPKKGPQEIGACLSRATLRRGGSCVAYAGRNHLRIFEFDAAGRRVTVTYQRRQATSVSPTTQSATVSSGSPGSDLGALYCFCSADSETDWVLSANNTTGELLLVTISTHSKRAVYSAVDPVAADSSRCSKVFDFHVAPSGVAVFRSGQQIFFGRFTTGVPHPTPPTAAPQPQQLPQPQPQSPPPPPSQPQPQQIQPQLTKLLSPAPTPTPTLLPPPPQQQQQHRTTPAEASTGKETKTPKEQKEKSGSQQARLKMARFGTKLKMVTQHFAEKMKEATSRADGGLPSGTMARLDQQQRSVPQMNHTPLIHRLLLDVPLDIVYKPRNISLSKHQEIDNNNTGGEEDLDSMAGSNSCSTLLVHAPLLAFLPCGLSSPPPQQQHPISQHTPPSSLPLPLRCQLVNRLCDNVLKLPNILARPAATNSSSPADTPGSLRRSPAELNTEDFVRHDNSFRDALPLTDNILLVARQPQNDLLLDIALAKISCAASIISLRALSPILVPSAAGVSSPSKTITMSLSPTLSVCLSSNTTSKPVQDRLTSSLSPVAHLADPALIVPSLCRNACWATLEALGSSLGISRASSALPNDILETLSLSALDKPSMKRLIRRAYEGRPRAGMALSLSPSWAALELFTAIPEATATQVQLEDQHLEGFFTRLAAFPDDVIHLQLPHIVIGLARWGQSCSLHPGDILDTLQQCGSRLKALGINSTEAEPLCSSLSVSDSNNLVPFVVATLSGIDASVALQVDAHQDTLVSVIAKTAKRRECTPHRTTEGEREREGEEYGDSWSNTQVAARQQDGCVCACVGVDVSGNGDKGDVDVEADLALFGPITTLISQRPANRQQYLSTLSQCLLHQESIARMLEGERTDVRRMRQSTNEALARVAQREAELQQLSK